MDTKQAKSPRGVPGGTMTERSDRRGTEVNTSYSKLPNSSR